MDNTQTQLINRILDLAVENQKQINELNKRVTDLYLEVTSRSVNLSGIIQSMALLQQQVSTQHERANLISDLIRNVEARTEDLEGFAIHLGEHTGVDFETYDLDEDEYVEVEGEDDEPVKH